MFSLLFNFLRKQSAYRKLRKLYPTVGGKFSEKILYKMAWDRNPQLRVFASKVAVRQFVRDRAGEEYLVPIFGIYSRPEEIRFAALPKEYVVKVSHGSGGVVVVSSKANPKRELPSDVDVGWVRLEVHPESLDITKLIALLRYWQTLDYEWWAGRNPEWAYKCLRREILVEEILGSGKPEPIAEYKVFCFDGKAQVIRVDRGSVAEGKGFAHYDTNWSYLPVVFVEGSVPKLVLEPEKRPRFFRELIRVAELLARDTDFVRVDFLDDSGRLRVGELTNYPTAGQFEFIPESFSYWIGKDWHPVPVRLRKSLARLINTRHPVD